YDDIEQINDDDMEEMDLKWQLAMISMRIKKFHKRTGRKLQFDTKDPVSFDKTKVECFNCHKMGHFARDCRANGNQDIRRRDDGYNGNKTRDNGRRPAYQDDSKALVAIDGEDIDWSGHVEEDAQNYAMIAYASNNSGSDNKSVFMNKASDLDDTPVNDRFADGINPVPPPMTGNYMPSGPDVEIDYSKFTYGPKQTSADESDSKPSEYTSCESDSSVETSTSMPEPVENASKVVCEPKVWTNAPIIKEYESDSDNDSVSNDDPHRALKDKGIINSGCSRHMTGNNAHLVDSQEFKGGYVAFGGSNGRITGKGNIKDDRLDFEDVYYVEELKNYNLFSVSQICDNKNKVLFIDTDYLVLSLDFKLPDENQVLLKILREHNMYSFNLKNIDPSGDLACLFAKASIDESNKWHRRPGHVNFKNLNKLVKGNLVIGDKIEKNTGSKTYEKPVSQVELVFLEELEKLKRQEKEANDAAKSLRKKATHDIKNAITS
nr:ribonuclease H-like domain-containing protein [Tanacetum cinerariifolium]